MPPKNRPLIQPPPATNVEVKRLSPQCSPLLLTSNLTLRLGHRAKEIPKNKD
jgi:hypothetical protein